MSIKERLELIKQVGEEIVTEEELKLILETKKQPIAYDGFEPSGTSIHIAQGLLRAINVNKMTKAGCRFIFLVADWHAWANNKMEGDLEKIQKVGKYLIEVWKACDMDLKNVEFVWANELMKDQEYLKKVMQVARNSTVKRIIRCGQIMGRKEAEVLQASQIFYPCMQAADIFQLKVDICQLGLDQRRVSTLAREIGHKLGFWKPAIVSHHMLRGLGEPIYDSLAAKDKIKTMKVGDETDFKQRIGKHSVDIYAKKNKVDFVIEMKMSKSNPDSAIFMTETEEEIKRKIKKAYCPEGITEENPILEYNKYIIFEKFKTVKIERSENFGGNLEFINYKELETAFREKKLHPMDLKQSTSYHLNQLIEPIRKKLEKNPAAKKLEGEINNFKVTR